MGDYESSQVTSIGLAEATLVVDMAWNALPAGQRSLLEAIGADQRRVVIGPLGVQADALHVSAGIPRFDPEVCRELDRALGIWLSDLRVVLIRLDHPVYAELDRPTVERFLARVAWHEWGHALGLDRSTNADIRSGARLLAMAPRGISENIRAAGYGRKDFTHELVAEVYALLMGRRQRGETGRPEWLANEIWEIVERVTGWTD